MARKETSWASFIHAAYLCFFSVAAFVFGEIFLGAIMALFAALAICYAVDRRRRVKEGRATFWW